MNPLTLRRGFETSLEIIITLIEAAPLTIAATRELFGRLTERAPNDRDVIERVYGSHDFSGGVSAFLAKRKPSWRGA